MRALLHRIFAAIRFVQLEWSVWLAEQPSIEEKRTFEQLEAPISEYESRIRAAERDIRDSCSKDSYTGEPVLSAQQIRNAAIGYVEAAIILRRG